MKFNNIQQKNKGFTILEMMISVSIFAIIMVFGVSTLINANVVHNKSEDMRSIMDNLSFILEDMSRNMRTGFDFRCFDGSPDLPNNLPLPPSDIDEPISCPSGGYAIAFEESRTAGNPEDDNDQWVYKVISESGEFIIQKSVNGGVNFTPMNLGDIVIDGGVSPFSVFGAEPPLPGGGGDRQQPFVTIRLVGDIHYKGTTTPFNLQTTVSQRLIDADATP